MLIRRMLIHCAGGLRAPVALQAVEIVGVHTVIAENTLEIDAAAHSRRGVIAHFIHSSPGQSGRFRALGADLPSEISGYPARVPHPSRVVCERVGTLNRVNVYRQRQCLRHHQHEAL